MNVYTTTVKLYNEHGYVPAGDYENGVQKATRMDIAAGRAAAETLRRAPKRRGYTSMLVKVSLSSRIGPKEIK